MIIRQFIYLELGKEKLEIQEPTIYDNFYIEYLLKDKANFEENMKKVFKILGLDEKYIYLAEIILNKVLGSFRKKDKKSGGADYFLGICGMLAFHNHLDLQTFLKTYTLSNLEELLKVHSYYHNLINGKSSENAVFNDKTEFAETEKQEMEEFIKEMMENEKD